MSDQQHVPSYPIQPNFIAVREIHFVAHRPPSKNDQIDQSQIKIGQVVGAFDESRKIVQVTLRAEFGFEEKTALTKSPFSLKVVITGEFSISDDFPKDKISLWSSRNAVFVLYPYLRERLYYLSLQGGYPPILLPLLQIPTIKIEQPEPSLPAVDR